MPNAYYFCVAIFFALCMVFAFGDIENSRNLQMFAAVMRFVVIALMLFGTVFYLVEDGSQHAPVFEWSTQLTAFATVFGNTVFTFIYQPAVPGIIYPVRPQKNLNSMFMYANILGALLLFAEA